MKDEEYTPLPINELLDLLSKNWGVPYDAEKQIWDYVQSLRPYLRHTSRCCGMLAGGPINPTIECHCTCGLRDTLRGQTNASTHESC